MCRIHAGISIRCCQKCCGREVAHRLRSGIGKHSVDLDLTEIAKCHFIFAEAFASYVHAVLMQRPFEIRITRNGAIEKVYASCWSQPRCADKRRLLEQFLQAERKS